MPANRGAFPGQWGLPGGGVEPDERIDDALHREIREELGIAVHDYRPLLFKDDVLDKLYADGRREHQHMIFLVYECRTTMSTVEANEEFDDWAWVEPQDVLAYDLNSATRDTLARAYPKDVLSSSRASDVEAVRGIAKEFAEGLNAGDIDRVLRCYADPYVDVNLREPVQTHALRRKYFESVLARGDFHFAVDPADIWLANDLALVHGSIVITPRQESQTAAVELRYMEVVRKGDDGLWKVTWGIDGPLQDWGVAE